MEARNRSERPNTAGLRDKHVFSTDYPRWYLGDVKIRKHTRSSASARAVMHQRHEIAESFRVLKMAENW